MALAVDWMIPSRNVTGRYDNIWFPQRDFYFLQGNLFRDNILLAPRTYFAKISDSVDFCNDSRRALATMNPQVWNNSAIISPCQEYFCGSNIPEFWPKNTSNEVIVTRLGLLANRDVLHKMAQNWCTLCSGSYSERFDLVLNSSTNCNWFNNTCASYCPDDIPCVYFNNRNNLCYAKDNTYLSRVDGFHYFFVKLRLYLLPWVYLTVNVICLLINIFCVIIPEFTALVLLFKNPETRSDQKWRSIFSLRNQSMFLEVSMNFLFVVGGIIDVIGFSTFNVTGFLVYIHFASALYSWALLVLLWRHIENQSDGLSSVDRLSSGLKVGWAIVTIVGLMITFIQVAIIILLAVLVDTPYIIIAIIILLIYTSILTFFMLIVSCVLIILAIRLFVKLSPPADPLKLTTYLFQLKLTRSIIFFTILVPPTVYTAILSIIMLFWGDIFTVYYNIAIHNPLYCIVSSAYSLLTVFTLIHNANFMNFWVPVCKCKKIEG